MALLCVALVAAAQVVGWLVYEAVHEGPSARSLTERCLRVEKQLPFRPMQPDPPAHLAADGGIELRVEGARVHVVFADSKRAAERLVQGYQTAVGALGDRIEQRGSIVYIWEASPSPTQRQTIQDCWYG